MNILKTIKILSLCSALSFTISACNNADSGLSSFAFAQNKSSTSFDKEYLVSNPWYGVAATSKHTKCLSKYVFWDNEVVTATNYNNDDGASLESEDLLYSITPDTRISIAKRYFYNYQSHGKQFFITKEAHFFRDYDEAIRFAEERGVDCRNSLAK